MIYDSLIAIVNQYGRKMGQHQRMQISVPYIVLAVDVYDRCLKGTALTNAQVGEIIFPKLKEMAESGMINAVGTWDEKNLSITLNSPQDIVKKRLNAKKNKQNSS